MTRHKQKKKAPVSAEEKEQVQIRRPLGLPIIQDEFGRDRLAYGTAEAARAYDRSNGGIVRLRLSDPLKDVRGLSTRQRNAGLRYRDEYEAVANIGIKPASMEPRVDAGSNPGGVSAAVLDALRAVRMANEAIPHHEIVMVVASVCGERRSIREIAEQTRDPRPALAKLLSIGLDKLADHYFGKIKPTM